MRILFTWLLTLGILLGLQGNAFAADPCDVLIDMHAQEHSHHEHDSEEPCDPNHDENCPLGHHQAGGNCCHTMPLADEKTSPGNLGGLGFSLSPIQSETTVAPEPPFVDLDKPPLN